MRRQSRQAGNATKTRHGQVDAVPTSFCVQEERDASASPIVKLPSCWHNQTNCRSCRFVRAGFTMCFHSAGRAAPIDRLVRLACRHACVLALESSKVGGDVFAMRFCCRNAGIGVNACLAGDRCGQTPAYPQDGMCENRGFCQTPFFVQDPCKPDTGVFQPLRKGVNR